jgi:hypothetical protein
MDARFLGFWILGLISLFIMFEVMRPGFLWLTYSLLFSSYYPHFLYKSAQTFTTWINDFSIFFGQHLVVLSVLIVAPYRIMRAMICKFNPKYKLRLLVSVSLFLIVFIISYFLEWSYHGFAQTKLLDPLAIPVYLLISMSVSILEELLREVWLEK